MMLADPDVEVGDSATRIFRSQQAMKNTPFPRSHSGIGCLQEAHEVLHMNRMLTMSLLLSHARSSALPPTSNDMFTTTVPKKADFGRSWLEATTSHDEAQGTPNWRVLDGSAAGW